MERKKLTKMVVDALDARPKEYIAWCSKLAGFGCRVHPTGRKTFVAQYRINGGTMRKATIGTFGKWTVEQARTEAETILFDASKGNDRAAAKAAAKTAPTVEELCAEYLAEGCERKAKSTLATDQGSIARHIIRLLGNKKVKDVTNLDIERFAADVAKGKTAIDVKTKKHGRARVRGGQGAANRTVRLLGGIFTFAIKRGYIEKNPRTGVKLKPDGKCERFLSNDELQRLGEALREAETVGLPWHFNNERNTKHRPIKAENQRVKINEHAVAAIRLLILTGMRCGEVMNLRWSQVDIKGGFLNLPTSKTGPKKVMLGAPALTVLADLPRIDGNPFVIVGSAADKPLSDLKRPWKRITAHAKLDVMGDDGKIKPLRIHDLRHSFASVGAGSGMGLPMIGKLLGHASPATTHRYAHLADDPQRTAADTIASTIAAAMDGKDAGNVVPLKGAA